MAKQRKQIVSFYIEGALFEKLTKRAESKQRSLSQVVALIVRKEFAPKEAKA